MSETVEQAAGRAATRWRTVTIGLAIIGVSSITNNYLNAAQLSKAHPVTCIVVATLSEQALKQRLNQ